MPGPRQISKRSAPKRSTPKRSTPKRSASKRSAPKRSATKRSALKRSAAKQSASKRSASKRSASKRSASKRSASKQSASKQSASKRSASKRSASKRSAHVSKRKRYSLRSHSVRSNYFGQNAQLLKSLNEKEKDVLKSLLGAARLENFSQTKKVAKLLAHKKNMEIIHKKLIEYAIMAKEDKNYELIDNAFKVLPILHNRFNAVWLDVQEMKKPPAIIHQEV